ncbi:DNA-3-methyladenine glycosylase I [Marinoscillum sp. MHG1-6]|uniref:DNA-3-methyladenine glycosylase I n=1 Tax=Marinoscillum sp. MHG1-6 TaxID=2959627 RepID=UPI00215876A1|nr:DNA-3-methyladenine glycosylase I [Marinoscillum sp. MHG1-6]
MAIKRCQWAEGMFDEYVKYHDEEWGVPVYDDQVHFEFLILESAQAGLSWSTVLKKREGYRKAFANFDVNKVSEYDESHIEELTKDLGIIRNRQKIAAAVNNANRFLEVQKEFGSFSNYIWGFVNNKTIDHECKSSKSVPATSPESDLLAKDLKKRGFKFLGSTTIYAHMQATGLINDHTVECFRHKQV